MKLRPLKIAVKLLRQILYGLLATVIWTSPLFASNFSVQAQNIRNVKLDLNVDNTSLKEVFHQIEKQTSFEFVYDHNKVDTRKLVNLKGINKSVADYLADIAQVANLKFKQINNQITVNKLEPSEGVKPVEVVIDGVTISGRVISGDDNMGLPGVNVIEKGTTNGTITDVDGNYSLQVTGPSSVVIFSSVGYVSQELTIGARRIIDAILAPDVTALQEVVIVGYGVQKKESIVGAISQMSNKALIRSGTQDVTNAIAGELSGVLTIQNQGEPGASKAEIIIRGLSSWNGSQPLVLVDGVERDFTDMNPNEIESINVLKDASATAVFGAKGGNGVILVTTRRGKLGKPQMDFSGSYGFQKAAVLPDYIDSYTTMSALNTAFMNGQQFQDVKPDYILNEYRNPSTSLNALQYPDVDWFDMLTNWAAPTADANLNITGGTEFAKYFCAFGYYYVGDFFKAYDDGKYVNTHYNFHRFNVRVNTDFNLTKSTVLSFNIGGDLDNKNQPRTSMWRNLYSTSGSRFPAYFPEFVLEQYPDLDYPDARGQRNAQSFGDYTGSPYNLAYSGGFNQYTGSKLYTDLTLKQELDDVVKGLSVQGKISLNTYSHINSLNANYNFPEYQFYYDRAARNDLIQQKINDGTYDPALDGVIENPWYRNGQGDEVWVQPPVDVNVGSMTTSGDDVYYKDLYYEASINYARSFNKHNVSGLALINRQEKRKGTAFPYYNTGVVGRITYDYAQKYLVEVNMGYTGSERFSPKNRFGIFPSVAVGWTPTQEEFFKNALPVFSFLKFRYSDGLVGSDIADNRWLYITNFEKDNRGRIREGKGPNPVAQWEESRKRDIGMEFGLFDDKLRGSVDFFDEHRTEMILAPRGVTILVGREFKEQNLGELKKHGFEVELEYNTTTASNFNYYIKGIFGYNDNRIIFKDDPVQTPEYLKDAGKPLGSQKDGVLLTGNGYYESVDDINNYVSPIAKEKLVMGDYKFLDYNSDGVISTLDKYPIKGSTYAPITFALTPGFTWRGFDFNIMFQGNYGKYVEFNQTYESEFVKGNWRIHESQVDYWTPYNQDVNHSTLHYSGSSSADILFWGGGEADRGYDIMIENRFWRDASYIRIRKIYLGYSFKSNGLNKLVGVDNMLVYATANNIFTITNLIEGDPERKDFNQGFYPQMAQYNLGLKLSF